MHVQIQSTITNMSYALPNLCEKLNYSTFSCFAEKCCLDANSLLQVSQNQ